MQFETVFDAAQSGYTTWLWPAYGIPFVIVGFLMVFAPNSVKKLMPDGLQGVSKRIFSWFFLCFGLFATVDGFKRTYGEYDFIRNSLETGQYQTVEGMVADLISAPKRESFKVNGVPFMYTGYELTNGFNNTANFGGPIREGLYVRIAYVENIIIKLEVEKGNFSP